MKKYDTIIGIVLFFVSVILSIGAIKLRIGKFNDFGPGFFPLLAGLFIAVFSLIIIISSLRGSPNSIPQHDAFITGKTTMIVIILLLFGLFVENAGFFLCAFFASLLMLRINGIKKWPYLLFVPGLICIGTFLIFNILLKVRLPFGILGSIVYSISNTLSH